MQITHSTINGPQTMSYGTDHSQYQECLGGVVFWGILSILLRRQVSSHMIDPLMDVTNKTPGSPFCHPLFNEKLHVLLRRSPLTKSRLRPLDRVIFRAFRQSALRVSSLFCSSCHAQYSFTVTSRGPVILNLLFDGAGLGVDVAMRDSFVPCVGKR